MSDQATRAPSKYTRRQRLERLRVQLENERSTFRAHWRDLSDFIAPRRARFFVTDVNKGDRRNQRIIDSTATLALRTLRSGMMTGITSPARSWFRLSVSNPVLSDLDPVKKWLHETSEVMKTAFLRSNLYNVLPNVYGDMGLYATGCMLMQEDFNKVFHFDSIPIGSYSIGTNAKGQVNVFVREFRMTVREVVETFGKIQTEDQKDSEIDWTNISTKVKSLYDANNTEAWIDICHTILPNELYDPKMLSSKFKKYASIYYEKGYSTNGGSQGTYTNGIEQDKFLRESGYNFFPVLAPRWSVTGEDVYGTDCPGMVALGDTRQLQKGESRGLIALDKMVNPPMKGPAGLKQQKASLLPGDITYVDESSDKGGFKPIHEVRFDLNSLEAKQSQVRQRISRAFYEDLFLMLAQSDRRQITATEIDERREEKLLALGPVLEQLNQDLLDPLIDNAFDIMMEQGLIPEVPEELQGRDLKVEYISVMAQAQKLNGLGGIERFTNFVAGAANLAPAILDKINGDKLVDYYGDLTSVPPEIVRAQEETDNLRTQRAEAQAAAQEQEQMAQAAQTAKTLSDTPVEEGNALAEIAGGGIGI